MSDGMSERLAVLDVQARNFMRELEWAKHRFRNTGRKPAPVRLTRREHGTAGWLAFSYLGWPWKESTGLWAVQSWRAKVYATRERARRADVSE